MEQQGDSLPLIANRRNNRNGYKYRIEALSDDRTIISIPSEDKSIVVGMSYVSVLQAWFIWEYKNEPIQDAFPSLTAAEREFLISGSTEEEWNEMFGEEELNEGRTD